MNGCVCRATIWDSPGDWLEFRKLGASSKRIRRGALSRSHPIAFELACRIENVARVSQFVSQLNRDANLDARSVSLPRTPPIEVRNAGLDQRRAARVFEPMSKRRRGFPSETHVLRGVRVVHGDKLLEEKLGRNDLCPCGSGRRFRKCCRNGGGFRRRQPSLLLSANDGRPPAHNTRAGSAYRYIDLDMPNRVHDHPQLIYSPGTQSDGSPRAAVMLQCANRRAPNPPTRPAPS